MLCASPGFQAPPGAGKTTVVPLAMLLHDPEYLSTAAAGGKKIMVLEPRRVAAKAAARRMASMLGEAVGETVGYRVKLDTRIGPRTRIEVRASGWFCGSSATPHCCAHLTCMMQVVTDGILIRMLQHDPELTGIGAVLFDEFHERNLDRCAANGHLPVAGL